MAFLGTDPTAAPTPPFTGAPFPPLCPVSPAPRGTHALSLPPLRAAPGGQKKAARPGEGWAGLSLQPLGLAPLGTVNPLEVWHSPPRGCQAHFSHTLHLQLAQTPHTQAPAELRDSSPLFLGRALLPESITG